jgi:hypothetical protein
MNDLQTVARATYEAMATLPPFAVLAIALDAATSRDERVALVNTVDAATRDAAVAYLQDGPHLRERNRRLAWLREDPLRFDAVKRYYADHIAQFIDDWGLTHDPRLLARGGSAIVPFKLWPKQWEMIEFMSQRYRNAEDGVITKGRDLGASWCAMTWLTSLALFHAGFTAIIGSALEAKIDLSGTTGTLMYKARSFLQNLPEEFRGGWNADKFSAHMRIWFPNGSSISGQAGLQIGRGERASCVVIDEHAFVEHAETVDAALMATSDVRLYISTVNGMDNLFAQKAHNNAIPRLTVTVNDDPRKTAAWREKKIAADGLQRFKREYLCDFLAGSAGQLIPREHLEACIDAHLKLGIEPVGRRFAGFDIGGGGDPSAFAVVKGCLVENVVAWPSTTNLVRECREAFKLADAHGVTEFCADAVGIGAAIEGDAQILNEERKGKGLKPLLVHSFKGSEAALFPESPALPGATVKTKDAYLNRKSQAYAWLAYRAAETFKAASGEKIKCADDLLSISSTIPDLNQLLAELGQITAEESTSGRLKIDKYGEGFSPNRADAVAMACAPRNKPLNINDDLIGRLMADAENRSFAEASKLSFMAPTRF